MKTESAVIKILSARQIHRLEGCGAVKDEREGDSDCSYDPPFRCDDCMFVYTNIDKRIGKDPLADKYLTP